MVKSRNLKNPSTGKSQRLDPFEAALALESFLSVELEGQNIGAAILKHKSSGALKVQFAFDCAGIHPWLRPESIDPIFDSLAAGLKDFPSQETLTIRLGSFTDDVGRQRELKQLINSNQVSEFIFLLLAERKRVQQLTQQGLRKVKFLRLYCTYSLDAGEEELNNPLEKFLNSAENWWLQFTGQYSEREQTRIEKQLYSAYLNGYRLWQQFLTNKLGLTVRPFSVEEFWADLWYRFNDTPPRPVPQKVILDSRGIREEFSTTIHPLSLLLESEQSVPVAERHYVKLKDKYIGALLFADKPAGWRDKLAQLRYLWELIAEDKISDTEIVCQLWAGNPNLLKQRMQSLTKQANNVALEAALKNNVDVSASLRQDKAIAAQTSLYSGEMPLYLSLVFLVYRASEFQLEAASKVICSKFKRPAWVVREKEYAWKLWLDSLPVAWQRMLTHPFKRNSIYLTGEAPGLMPLVKTRKGDSSGFELIAQEGGTPIYLDLYRQHRHLAIFGATRSGKSVLVAGILLQALFRGLPVAALDFPRPDGTGTFSDLCQFLGKQASYFDIGSESANLFEPPDLRGLPRKLQGERFADYKDFLVEVLMLMVVGLSFQGDVNPDSVRSLLTLAIDKFFNEPEIHQRYGSAFQAGFGTSAWQQMPVLGDFLQFLSLERLQILSPTPEIRAALEFCRLRLKFWLKSRVGSAISQPTTFRSDAPFLVIALRNLANQEDAALLASLAYLVALRRSLAAPASIFFIDEAPILFQFESIAALVAKLYANGAKSGIRAILSAQEPTSILQSPSGAKILANTNTRLVGRIEPTSVDSYVHHFKYPLPIIAVNGTEKYFPNKDGMYSLWLLDDGGVLTPTRYYSPLELLAAVANNPDEVIARQKAFAQYGNKFEAIAKLADQLIGNRI